MQPSRERDEDYWNAWGYDNDEWNYYGGEEARAQTRRGIARMHGSLLCLLFCAEPGCSTYVDVTMSAKYDTILMSIHARRVLGTATALSA